MGEIKNIHINWKHMGEVHQFTTASFSCAQLQKVLFKLGYRE